MASLTLKYFLQTETSFSFISSNGFAKISIIYCYFFRPSIIRNILNRPSPSGPQHVMLYLCLITFFVSTFIIFHFCVSYQTRCSGDMEHDLGKRNKDRLFSIMYSLYC